jgi:regulator of sigma D
MIYLVIGLSALVGLLGYLVYINYRRAEKVTEYCEAYVRFVSALYFKFYDTRQRMKEVDRLGAFQADDEVGVIFKELDSSIDDLYEFITKYVNTEKEKDKETKN